MYLLLLWAFIEGSALRSRSWTKTFSFIPDKYKIPCSFCLVTRKAYIIISLLAAVYSYSYSTHNNTGYIWSRSSSCIAQIQQFGFSAIQNGYVSVTLFAGHHNLNNVRICCMTSHTNYTLFIFFYIYIYHILIIAYNIYYIYMIITLYIYLLFT